MAITKSYQQAGYRGTEAQWLRLAAHFEQTDEPRLAKAIKRGVDRLAPSARYWHKHYGRDLRFMLRFRGGSIAKIDAAIAKGVTNE